MAKQKTVTTKKRPTSRKKSTSLKAANNKTNKFSLVAKMLSLALFIVTIFTVTSLALLQILPLRFLLPATIIPIFIAFIVSFLVFWKSRTTRANIIFSIISSLFIIVNGIVIFYAINTHNLLGLFDRYFSDHSYVNRVRDITRDSFILYVSGLDDGGERSDVNQLIVVNPRTHQILIHNTPRDYGVFLYGKPKIIDKLTHANIYGTEVAVNTIEKLYDIDINYFVQIEFETVVRLVDAIGGISVYSPHSFSADGQRFHRGINHMNGKQALAFSRDRTQGAKTDNARGENQQLVLSAILQRLASPAILTNYSSIIGALNGTFTTNFTSNEVARFVRFQLDVQPNWNIQHSAVVGTHTWGVTTYTYPDLKLYVAMPQQDSIDAAKERIQKVLK
jgi:LCP family protein required for cell wall assembly